MTGALKLGALFACLSVGGCLLGQPKPAEEKEPSARQWSFELTGDGYIVPQDSSYGSVTFSADRKWLHLETRYNYEDRQTGSAWLGYSLERGDKLKLRATPMIGGVFGNTTGVAPGYEVSLAYRRLEFTTDGEYVFDTRNSSGSFFYDWAELSYSPLEWFRFGIASQKTKTYHTALNIQRGVFLGFSHKKLDFATYVFNAGWTDPTVVLHVAVSF